MSTTRVFFLLFFSIFVSFTRCDIGQFCCVLCSVVAASLRRVITDSNLQQFLKNSPSVSLQLTQNRSQINLFEQQDTVNNHLVLDKIDDLRVSVDDVLFSVLVLVN